MRKLVVIPNLAGGARCIKITMAMPAGGANPNLGCIETPPFYALRLYPSDIGTSRGLVTDNAARVLDAGDQPIAGLYACGNDMQSIMGGTYPGPGITLGPAIAFAYIAASDAAGRMGLG